MAVIDLVPVDRMLLILQHTPGSPPGVIERLLQILPADGMPDLLPATEALRA
jgi:hypothetical protein